MRVLSAKACSGGAGGTMTDLGECEIAEHQTEKGPAGDLSIDERVGQYATIEVSEM